MWRGRSRSLPDLLKIDDSLVGTEYGTVNLLRMDDHDLECLLCRSSALKKVLAEYGDESKISQFEKVASADLLATTLWTDMRTWEAGNHPFRVLQVEDGAGGHPVQGR